MWQSIYIIFLYFYFSHLKKTQKQKQNITCVFLIYYKLAWLEQGERLSRL